METWLDREHRLRARAEHVADLLERLWGDLPPPGLVPQLTTLVDAVAGDDEHGRDAQLVVHGDGLTYQQLARVLLEAGPGSRARTLLPSDLLQRLTEAGATTPPALSPGMVALPDEDCGLWELDAGTGLVSFDAPCARLLGVGHRPGRHAFPLRPQEQHAGSPARSSPVHPDDAPRVRTALAESLHTGRPYQTRFRVLLPDGTRPWRLSRARVLPTGRAGHARLVGFVAADDD